MISSYGVLEITGSAVQGFKKFRRFLPGSLSFDDVVSELGHGRVDSILGSFPGAWVLRSSSAATFWLVSGGLLLLP